MKGTRKFLAILLAICMVVTLTPMAVSAEEPIAVDLSESIADLTTVFVDKFDDKFNQVDPIDLTVDDRAAAYYVEIGDYAGEAPASITFDGVEYAAAADYNVSVGQSSYITDCMWKVEGEKFYIALPWLALVSGSATALVGDTVYNIVVYDPAVTGELTIESVSVGNNAGAASDIRVAKFDGTSNVVTAYADHYYTYAEVVLAIDGEAIPEDQTGFRMNKNNPCSTALMTTHYQLFGKGWPTVGTVESFDKRVRDYSIAVAGIGSIDIHYDFYYLPTAWSVAPDLEKADLAWYYEDAYVLSDEADLLGFAYLVNNGYDDFSGKTVTLGANIELSGAWAPIGTEPVVTSGAGGLYSKSNVDTTNANKFKGIFDGNERTISGMAISSDDLEIAEGANGYAGMFIVTEGATIKDLTLEDVVMSDTTGQITMAPVVGFATNTDFINVAVTGASTLSGRSIGGLAGVVTDCDFTGCSSNATITAKDTAVGKSIIIGGIARQIKNSTAAELLMDGCTYSGNINVEATNAAASFVWVGGMFGCTAYSSPAAYYPLRVKDCQMSGSIAVANAPAANHVYYDSNTNSAVIGNDTVSAAVKQNLFGGALGRTHIDLEVFVENDGVVSYSAGGGVGSGVTTFAVNVAKIGETYYPSLAAAVAAVTGTDTATIQLTNNAVLDAPVVIDGGKNINLNLNGFNVTTNCTEAYTPFELLKIQGAALNLTGQGRVAPGGTYFVHNTPGIRMIGSTDEEAENYSVLTVGENVTVGGYAHGIQVANNANCGYGVVVNIDGTLDTSKTAQDATYVNDYETAGITINGNINKTTGNVAQININEGTQIITSDEGTGVYAAGYGVWNMAAGATIDAGVGIEIRSGVLNMAGGTIDATGSFDPDPAAYSNGSIAGGVGIGIVTNANYAGKMEVNLSGGTINSTKGYAVWEYHGTSSGAADSFALADGVVLNGKQGDILVRGVLNVLTGKTLALSAGENLTVAESAKLVNNGTINNAGAIVNSGSIVNNGKINGNQPGGEIVDNEAVVAAVEAAVAEVSTETTVEKAKEIIQTLAQVDNTALVETSSEGVNLGLPATLETKLATLEEAYVGNNIAPTEATVHEDLAETIGTVDVDNAALSVPATAGTEQAPAKAKVEVTPAVAPVLPAGADNNITPIALSINLSIVDSAAGTTTEITTPAAPIVLKFNIPAGVDPYKARIYHVKKDDSTEIIVPRVEGNQFVFAVTSFSTFTVYQATVENPNAYEIIFTPQDANVSGGEEVTYDIAIKRVAGGNDISRLGVAFNFDETKFDFVSAAGDAQNSVVFTNDKGTGSGEYDGYLFSRETAWNVGTSAVAVGTITLKAKNIPATADMAELDAHFTYVADSGISNASLNKNAGLTLTTNTTSYRNLTVTFDGDGTEGDQVYYVKHGDSALYETAAYAVEATVADPVTKADNRIHPDKWVTADGTKYAAANTYTSSTIYLAAYRPEYTITLPDPLSEGITAITLGAGAEGTPATAAQDFDLNFTVTVADGYAVDAVTYQIGTADPVNAVFNDEANAYVIGGALITGPVTLAATAKAMLTEDNVGVFLGGDPIAFVPFSDYSGSKTLVLLKTPDNVANIALTGGGAPAVYDIPDNVYVITSAAGEAPAVYATHAVLIDSTGITASKAGMIAYLNGIVDLTAEENAALAIAYDWNTNGVIDARVADVQATYDFSSLSPDQLQWTPTDDLLLKADVMTFADQEDKTLDTAPDGTVNADDVNAFLYKYARFPFPATVAE